MFEVSAGSESAVIGPLSSSTTAQWQTYTLTFVATSSTTRIQFTDLGTVTTGMGFSFGAYIDAVSVHDIGCKPGNGFGDKNHCHSGPPGQNKG